MHEAQTPDNGADIKNFNSVDSTQSPSRAINPFHSILTGDNQATELLLLAPASEQLQPIPAVEYPEEENGQEVTEDIDTIDTQVEIIIDSPVNHSPQLDDEESNLDNPPENDWVAEPNVEQQARVNGEFQQLLKLNQELRSANNKLYEQVEQLTITLNDSEKALRKQTKRSTVAESMLKQQTQELTAAQAQIQSLFEQLENAAQNVQSQESLAESYREQLEFNQQRLAQLERECVSIQTKYSEQSQLLSQSENVCRELRTRLKRQQRQTLQFKAALEKSLESSIPGYDNLDEDDSNSPDIINNSRASKSKPTSISSIQPIQPWSAPEDSYKTQNDIWAEILATPPANEKSESIEEESTSWEFTANTNIKSFEEDAPNAPNQNQDSVNSDFLNLDSTSEEVNEREISSEKDSSQLEEKLDSVIQTFFASQTQSESELSPQQDAEKNESNSYQPEIPNWEPIIEACGNNNDVVNIETHPSESKGEQKVSLTSSMNDSAFDETQDYWEEISHYPAFDLSENATSFGVLSDTDHHQNSPSPLIYPKRPPKGRKSLASVELPSFPHKSDGDDSYTNSV